MCLSGVMYACLCVCLHVFECLCVYVSVHSQAIFGKCFGLAYKDAEATDGSNISEVSQPEGKTHSRQPPGEDWQTPSDLACG